MSSILRYGVGSSELIRTRIGTWLDVPPKFSYPMQMILKFYLQNTESMVFGLRNTLTSMKSLKSHWLKMTSSFQNGLKNYRLNNTRFLTMMAKTYDTSMMKMKRKHTLMKLAGIICSQFGSHVKTSNIVE